MFSKVRNPGYNAAICTLMTPRVAQQVISSQLHFMVLHLVLQLHLKILWSGPLLSADAADHSAKLQSEISSMDIRFSSQISKINDYIFFR